MHLVVVESQCGRPILTWCLDAAHVFCCIARLYLGRNGNASTLNLKRELLVAAPVYSVGLLAVPVVGGEMHLGAVLAATLSL